MLLLLPFFSQANEILHHKLTLNGYLAEFTGQSMETITADTDRDFFMSAQEAVSAGVAAGWDRGWGLRALRWNAGSVCARLGSNAHAALVLCAGGVRPDRRRG